MRSFQLEPQLNYRKLLRYELTANLPQDLYEKNFSTAKSGYGTDLLGNGVFTGESILSTVGSPATKFYTDSGEVLVSEERYRCTRSVLKLVSIDTIGATVSTAPTEVSDGWTEVQAESSLLRYLKSNINATVTIEVGISLVTSIIDETAMLVNPFPSWMAIRKDQASVGYKMMNVMAQEIEDFKFQSISFPQRSFIDSIPTGIKYRAYLSLLSTYEAPIDVVGDTHDLSPAEDLTEFIEAGEDEHVYYQEGPYLFTTGVYTALTINGVLYPQEEVHIANAFDHLGASISLTRLPEETNAAYRLRLLDVFANPPGASWGRIQRTIERESGVSIENIWELHDGKVPWAADNNVAVSHVFYADPTTEHRELARWCNENARIGFDYMRWGQMMWDLYPHPWDLAEIPYLLDQVPISGSKRPGIGYGDDIKASPYEHTGSFSFMVEVNAVGKVRSTSSIYPPVTVSGEIIPTATKTTYQNSYSGRVALKLVAGGLDYYVNADVSVANDLTHALNTNSWHYLLPQFSTEQNIACALSTDTTATPVNIKQANITLYGIYDGYWNFSTGTLVANNPANKLWVGFSSTVTAKTSKTWTVAIEGGHPEMVYADVHDMAGSANVVAWIGAGTPFSVTCNPNMAALAGSIPIPQYFAKDPGLGTVTYTLTPLSVFPPEATYTLAFSSGGSTIQGWPSSAVTINLSSTYQRTEPKLTDGQGTAQVFSGTVTPDNPIAVFAVDKADFSLAATFEQGHYTSQTTGQVYVRLPQEVEDSAELVVELNPVYTFEWAPKTQPGTLYLSGYEFYQHADPEVETVSGTTHILAYPVAPGTIITTNGDLQELHFTDANGTPSLNVTQEILGNGTRYLPTWFQSIKTITVDGVSKSKAYDGIIDYGSATDPTHTYQVVYRVTSTFCVDYNHIENGEYRPLLTFETSATGTDVTYTPYNKEGYWVDTDIPTNPLFTTKNRDFLYMDDETITIASVTLLTEPYYFFAGQKNLVCAKVLDADGNGMSGQNVHFTTDDAQSEWVVSDPDGYAYARLLGPASPTATVTVTVAVGAHNDSQVFTMVQFYKTQPQGLYLISQNFQVADSSQSTAQVIKLLLLNTSGVPVQTTGSYTVWCKNSLGNVTTTSISTDSSGIATLTYTPTYAGQYVATFTIGGETKEVGWCLVDRI